MIDAHQNDCSTIFIFKFSNNLKSSKMKKTIAIVIVLFISLTAFAESNFIQQQKKSVDATYVGVTEDDLYEFTTEEGKTMYFDQVSDNVEVDLYDDENLEKKFSITWEEEREELVDEEGEPTGEIQIIKTITALEEV